MSDTQAESGRSDETIAPGPTLIQSVTGPRGSRLAAWLDSGPHLLGGYLRPLVGPLESIVAVVVPPPELEGELVEGLPPGEARAEAIAARARQRQLQLATGTPVPLRSAHDLERLCRARGRSSLEQLRRDPSLVAEMQVGSWFQTGWRGRAARRLLVRVPWIASLARRLAPRAGVFRLSSDVWFWVGVRSAATKSEWRRLTRSSYVILCYHQLGPEIRNEELDVSARRFARQLRLLRLLRFRPLTVQELIDFHERADTSLPRRVFVITSDDAYVDAIETLLRHPQARAQLFVPTAMISKASERAVHAPLADWPRLQEAAEQGLVLGPHSRTHQRLPTLDDQALAKELAGSLADLRARVTSCVPILAYPFGEYDERVRLAAAAAGYRLAYTTGPGRNGAGTDPFCLRRITVQQRNGSLAFLWKVATGEPLPNRWERRSRRRNVRSADP